MDRGGSGRRGYSVLFVEEVDRPSLESMAVMSAATLGRSRAGCAGRDRKVGVHCYGYRCCCWVDAHCWRRSCLCC